MAFPFECVVGGARRHVQRIRTANGGSAEAIDSDCQLLESTTLLLRVAGENEDAKAVSVRSALWTSRLGRRIACHARCRALRLEFLSKYHL